MSLIIVSLLQDAQRAVVAVDTAARTVGAEAIHHTSKVIPFVQADAVLAARGNKRFLIDVYANLFNAMGRWSLDDAVDALATQADAMYAAWERLYRAEGAVPDAAGQELVLVGWSPRQQRFLGLVLERHADTDGFDVRLVTRGHVTPWHESMGPARIPQSIEAIAALAAAQVRYANRVSPETPIGGGLIVVDLARGDLRITQRPIRTPLARGLEGIGA